MIINPYRFSAAAGGITTPLHFWDLDDTGTGTGAGLDDQGNHTTDMTLQTNGAITTLTQAPDGGDCIFFNSNGEWLDTSSDIAWDSASDDMSCSCWFQSTAAATTFNSLVTWRGGAPFGWHLLAVNASPDYVTSTVWDDSATSGGTASTKVVAEDTAETSSLNTWYHAVITFESSTGTLKLYIDNVLIDSSVTGTVDAFNPNAIPFAIGALSSSKTNIAFQHRGYVWSTGIWDTVLTTDEISELYNSGSGGKYADYTWT